MPGHAGKRLTTGREGGLAETMLAVALLTGSVVPAQAVGFQDAAAPGPGHPAIQVGIRYPSNAATSDQRIELSDQVVASGGTVTGIPTR